MQTIVRCLPAVIMSKNWNLSQLAMSAADNNKKLSYRRKTARRTM